MIFHTSADKIYFDNFFTPFVNSIKKYYPTPAISFNFVGTEQVDIGKNVYYDTIPLSFLDLKQKYQKDDRDTKGYYALSRWLTIPVLDDHVAVCDIDVLAVNPIDTQLILNLLNTYEVINITRTKPNGEEGGMMIMILRKDICKTVKDYSTSLLNNLNLKWDTDVNVRSFLYNNFKVKNLLQMKQLSKKSSDFSNCWFAFAKGNTEKKLNYLKLVSA
jgi:hypothetical protein